MPQQIIISSTPEEVRMGLVNNGILQEFMVERAMSAHLVGSIFLGRVSNVVKGIQAAFIDIGLDQNAFLYLGDSSDLTEGADDSDHQGSPGDKRTHGQQGNHISRTLCRTVSFFRLYRYLPEDK